jgi:spore germination cell wall hydrolase CwlJ-like protein
MKRLAATLWRYRVGFTLGVLNVGLMLGLSDLRAVMADTPARRIAPPTAAAAHLRPVIPAPTLAAVAPQTFEPLTPDQAVLINERTPISYAPNPPARPFYLESASATDRARALTCLSMAVYYEAANQGRDGQAAVAQVVLNRLRNPVFPKTICGVVFEGSQLPTGCQFTFTCDGALARRPDPAVWRQSMDVAEHALDGSVQKAVGMATHFHTIWVVPYWSSSVLKVRQIGAHIFYRFDGGLGTPGAFNGLYAGGETRPPTLADFDTGVSPVLLRGESFVAPPSSAPQAVPPRQAVVSGPVKPVEVAALTLSDAKPIATDKLEPFTEGLDVRGPRTRRTPSPSGW